MKEWHYRAVELCRQVATSNNGAHKEPHCIVGTIGKCGGCPAKIPYKSPIELPYAPITPIGVIVGEVANIEFEEEVFVHILIPRPRGITHNPHGHSACAILRLARVHHRGDNRQRTVGFEFIVGEYHKEVILLHHKLLDGAAEQRIYLESFVIDNLTVGVVAQDLQHLTLHIRIARRGIDHNDIGFGGNESAKFINALARRGGGRKAVVVPTVGALGGRSQRRHHRHTPLGSILHHRGGIAFVDGTDKEVGILHHLLLLFDKRCDIVCRIFSIKKLDINRLTFHLKVLSSKQCALVELHKATPHPAERIAQGQHKRHRKDIFVEGAECHIGVRKAIQISLHIAFNDVYFAIVVRASCTAHFKEHTFVNQQRFAILPCEVIDIYSVSQSERIERTTLTHSEVVVLARE